MKHIVLLFILFFAQTLFAAESVFDDIGAFCEHGDKQSPVNITQVVSKELPQIMLDYIPIELFVQNTDVNVYLKPKKEISLEYDGGRYRLLEIHMHQPGEHTIDGKRFDLEVHYVHQAPDNHYMVIAQLFNIGHHNKVFERLLLQMALAKGQLGKTQIEFGYNPDQLIAKHHDYYLYNGSLTTEPCSQNVKWLVLKDTLEVTKGQVGALTDIIGYNARSIQPINGRMIYSSIP